MDTPFSPLSFRIQDGLARRWRKYPGPLALTLAALIVGPFAMGFVVMISLALGDMNPYLKGALMLSAMVGGGWPTMLLHDRLGAPLPRNEQWGMVERMGKKIVPTDRRLCRLEARLILNTQGEASQALARAHRLGKTLPQARVAAPPKGRF